MDLGWGPSRPDQWADPYGDTWDVNDSFDSTDIGDAVSSSAQKNAWAKASLYYCGKGLDGGADLRAVKSYIAALKRRKRPL